MAGTSRVSRPSTPSRNRGAIRVRMGCGRRFQIRLRSEMRGKSIMKMVSCLKSSVMAYSHGARVRRGEVPQRFNDSEIATTRKRIAQLPNRIVHFWRLISLQSTKSPVPGGPNRGQNMAKRPQNVAESCEFCRDFRLDLDTTCCPANEFPTATAAAMFAAVRNEQLERNLQQKSRAASTASPVAIPRKSLIREADPAKERKDKGKTAASRGPVPLIMA